MKLKMIKRSYSLEWEIALLISLGYCGYFLYGYFKNPEIIHDKSIFIGLAIFVLLFVMSLLGLLLGWEKREAINLDGWKYKLYGKNKRLFLLYTGLVDGLLFTALLLLIGYCSGWIEMSYFQAKGYLGIISISVVFMILSAFMNYRKYHFFDH